MIASFMNLSEQLALVLQQKEGRRVGHVRSESERKASASLT